MTLKKLKFIKTLPHFIELKSRSGGGVSINGSNISIKAEIEYLLKELKLTKNLNTGRYEIAICGQLCLF